MEGRGMQGLFRDGVWVLTGGLGTEIEARGVAIEGDPLWSARLLHSDPSLLQDIHLSFLRHGAQIITTASYQASVDGFVQHLSVSPDEALDLIGRSVTIAKQAREKFLEEATNNEGSLLIAGSVGPYGACQHDGSEYHGRYVDHMTEEQLMDWHRPRMARLVEGGVDLLAFETIPAQKEGVALVKLLGEFPNTKAWLSFSCKDEVHCCHGDVFRTAIESCSSLSSQLVGVGVNCTDPRYVEALLSSCVGVTTLPLIVYPNSGETWVRGEGWSDKFDKGFSSYLKKWAEFGVHVFGGCCRVTPSDIKLISDITRSLQVNVTSTSSRPLL